MSTNFDNMFLERSLPWDGLGTDVNGASNSGEAIKIGGLDWTVVQREILDSVTGNVIPKWIANVRETDDKVLGILNGNKYEKCQNLEAFEFTDLLVNEGEISYESAGSFLGGKRVWLLVKLPSRDIFGEVFIPYLVFTNSHDGSGGIKASIVPVRKVCKNTLNLALNNTERVWSCDRRGSLQDKLFEATSTLRLTNRYLKSLEYAFRDLAKIELDDSKVEKLIAQLLPIKNEDAKKKTDNTKEMRSDIFIRYKNAPDLVDMEENGFRFINAVSDFSIHTDLHRSTKYFDENRFLKVISGGSLLIDKAYKLLKENS